MNYYQREEWFALEHANLKESLNGNWIRAAVTVKTPGRDRTIELHACRLTAALQRRVTLRR